MPLRSWLLGLAGSLAAVACTQHAAEGQAAAPGPSSATPADTPPDEIEAEDIRIDLAPHGMAASIAAPHGAQARATNDGVELKGDDDFHLIVRRGSLDPLAEKASIVHAYGVGFRRFIRDRGTEVVYETSFAGENRFHFFLTSDVDAPIDYHCRTPQDGVASHYAIETMIAACREVRFLADIDPERSVSMADHASPAKP
jgi:hypothetical protein